MREFVGRRLDPEERAGLRLTLLSLGLVLVAVIVLPLGVLVRDEWAPLARLDDGCIDVRLIDADRPMSRLKLVTAVLTGRLGRSTVYEQRLVGSLPVRSRQGGLRIARDGEVGEGPGHMTLRAASRKLVVYLT